MKTRNVPIALILAASAALISLSARADGQAQTNTQGAQPIAGGVERPVGLPGGMGSLQSQLLSLTQTEFATPAARVRAIRQWQTANAAALQAEIDDNRATQQPDQARLRAARVKFDQALNDQVASGGIGTLEAEFIRLTHSDFDSPEQRGIAIRQWQAQHGAAIKAETDSRRAIEAASSAARQAQANQLLQWQIQKALAAGDIGPREAELMQLTRNPGLAPAAKRDAMRSWMAAHGAELNAEIAARQTSPPGMPVRPASPVGPSAP